MNTTKQEGAAVVVVMVIIMSIITLTAKNGQSITGIKGTDKRKKQLNSTTEQHARDCISCKTRYLSGCLVKDNYVNGGSIAKNNAECNILHLVNDLDGGGYEVVSASHFVFSAIWYFEDINNNIIEVYESKNKRTFSYYDGSKLYNANTFFKQMMGVNSTYRPHFFDNSQQAFKTAQDIIKQYNSMYHMLLESTIKEQQEYRATGMLFEEEENLYFSDPFTEESYYLRNVIF